MEISQKLSSPMQINYDEPLFPNVICRDNIGRDCGGLRVIPEVLENNSLDVPQNKLPQHRMSSDVSSPFGLGTSNEGLLYWSDHRKDDPHKFDVKGEIWITVDITNIKPLTAFFEPNDDFPRVRFEDTSNHVEHLETKEIPFEPVALVNVNTGFVHMMETDRTKYCTNGDIYRYNLHKEQLEYISNSLIVHYDIPDEIILEWLPEKYNSDLIIQTI